MPIKIHPQAYLLTTAHLYRTVVTFAGGNMPNIYSLISRKASGLVLAAMSISLISTLPASAQSFDTSQVGGVTMGANGPQGFLSMPNVPQVINVQPGGGPGFAIVGGSQAERSMAATGEQYHDSETTGPQAMRADGDYSSNRTSRSNPVQGMGSNFGLSRTETGLLSNGSVDNSQLPVNNRHFTFGFDNRGGGTYQGIYGADRAINGLINRLGGGVFTSGFQSLPTVSQGSVDISINNNHGR